MFYAHTIHYSSTHTHMHTRTSRLPAPPLFLIFSNFSQRPENLLSPSDSTPPFWGNDGVPSHPLHLHPPLPVELPARPPPSVPQSFDERPLHCMVATLHFLFGYTKPLKVSQLIRRPTFSRLSRGSSLAF